jgi:hypothetical protein
MNLNDVLSMLLALVMALLSAFGLAGCQTTKAVDGSSITRVDQEAAVVLLQSSLAIAETAYMRWVAAQSQMSAQEWQQGLETRKANIEMLQGLLKEVLAASAKKAVDGVKVSGQ